MSTVKEFVKHIPLLGPLARKIYHLLGGSRDQGRPFPGSEAYWEERYARGGNSGTGSYGDFAKFKAEFLNAFVKRHNVETVIEFGCGDGNQLTYADYPRYTGFDVSKTAIEKCRETFAQDQHKDFLLSNQYTDQTAELTLSLDVIYHLIEDNVFGEYMRHLFRSSTRFVIIYSSNHDNNENFVYDHLKHRKFTDWIGKNAKGWALVQHVPNKYPYKGDFRAGSFSDFFIYEKT